MRHTIYFLIAPKIDLVTRLGEMAFYSFSEFAQPIIWSGFEPDKSSLQSADLDTLAKILFLDVLLREWQPNLALQAYFLTYV